MGDDREVLLRAGERCCLARVLLAHLGNQKNSIGSGSSYWGPTGGPGDPEEERPSGSLGLEALALCAAGLQCVA